MERTIQETKTQEGAMCPCLAACSVPQFSEGLGLQLTLSVGDPKGGTPIVAYEGPLPAAYHEISVPTSVAHSVKVQINSMEGASVK